MYRPLSNPKRDEFVTNFNKVIKETMKAKYISCEELSKGTGIPRISIQSRLQFNRQWSFYDSILATDYLNIKRSEFTKGVRRDD
jgi:hypothetical protein